MPKTAAITPLNGKSIDSFIEQDYDIVCLTLSSKYLDFQNAYLTSQEYEQGRVVAVDSTLSGASALLTLKRSKISRPRYEKEIGQSQTKKF